MKKMLIKCLIAIVLLSSGFQSIAQVVSAKEQCAKMKRGVNIAGYDVALWKDHTRGRFKAEYFQKIKDAGFSTIRVNLFAFSGMDSITHKLRPEWLNTLDWVVKKGLEAKLMVILDMHEFTAMADDPVAKKEMFLSVWRQLAPRYKDTPSDVLFELLNEPNQKLSVQLWNEYLLEAINLVRETNPTRTLIIGPGNWNGIESLPTLVLPENDRNIIVTVHFYHPMPFTHQGAYWANDFKDLSGITWEGTNKEKADVETRLKVAADWSKANDRPVFLGEFGAYDKGDMDSRARYTAYVARTAEKFGFSWAYWQFDSDFIVYNIEKEQWVTPILNALMDKK